MKIGTVDIGYCPKHGTVNEACGECDDALLARITAERDAACRERRLAYSRGFHAGRKAQKARERAAPLAARLRAERDALQRERQRDYQRGYAAGRAKGPRVRRAGGRRELHRAKVTRQRKFHG